jgi:hypothetical protein
MTDQDIETAILDGIPDSELGSFLEWREKVRGANISERTLLATDYLNHFNEIVMLVEMIPDMPMMLDECRAWEPKSYQEHFRESGFSQKELAIAAYDRVPSKFKVPFEATIDQVHAVVRFTLDRLTQAVEQGEEERLRIDAAAATEMLHKIIQVANGIIHGTTHVMQQQEIDLYIGN